MGWETPYHIDPALRDELVEDLPALHASCCACCSLVARSRAVIAPTARLLLCSASPSTAAQRITRAAPTPRYQTERIQTVRFEEPRSRTPSEPDELDSFRHFFTYSQPSSTTTTCDSAHITDTLPPTRARPAQRRPAERRAPCARHHVSAAAPLSPCRSAFGTMVQQHAGVRGAMDRQRALAARAWVGQQAQRSCPYGTDRRFVGCRYPPPPYCCPYPCPYCTHAATPRLLRAPRRWVRRAPSHGAKRAHGALEPRAGAHPPRARGSGESMYRTSYLHKSEPIPDRNYLQVRTKRPVSSRAPGFARPP